ncbi:hypothetical protein AMEX_G5218 [Astyanax mexicanus]|uniref:Uncharacterized protein n=1 Tax=Astyanax mexicanus TaxID=7994 RepID=A0A8T2M920_ASTMX|nr:hypothetical protein AMEX_G5218 [Astyanax mexicanus]
MASGEISASDFSRVTSIISSHDAVNSTVIDILAEMDCSTKSGHRVVLETSNGHGPCVCALCVHIFNILVRIWPGFMGNH